MVDAVDTDLEVADRRFVWWAARLSCRVSTFFFLLAAITGECFAGPPLPPVVAAGIISGLTVLVYAVSLGFGVCGFFGGLIYRQPSTVGFAIVGSFISWYFLRFLGELAWWELRIAYLQS